MIRLAIFAFLTVLMAYVATMLLQRVVLAVLVAMMLLLSSGCSYYIVPAGRPKVKYCYPANNWRCDPRFEWSDM